MTAITTILWVIAATVIGAVGTIVGSLTIVGVGLAFIALAGCVKKVCTKTFARNWRKPRWLNEDNVTSAVAITFFVGWSVLLGILALHASETSIGWPDAPQWMNDLIAGPDE